MGISRADNSVKNWRNLPISNSKPDLHNINAHTKFGENPLMFTQVIIRKRKTDGHTTDGQTNGLTDDQRETIIPRYYCVAGYKNFLVEQKALYLELCLHYVLGKISNRWHEIFSGQTELRHFMQKLKCQILFSGKIRKLSPVCHLLNLPTE